MVAKNRKMENMLASHGTWLESLDISPKMLREKTEFIDRQSCEKY
jgi:hypothetical protein